jgi:ribosomal protein RSM22 (predicted rRNA methylase)
MTRNVLILPDEYTAALRERLEFDLSSQSLATRVGKAYIARKAEIVSHISEGLTTNRAEFLASGYLRQKEIREAYALYYMTTNLLKVIQPLRELSVSNFFELSPPLRILDLGTGTGAAAWGVLSYLCDQWKNSTPEITLTDSLGENLHEAENFSRHFVPRLPAAPKLAFEIFDLRKPEIIADKIKSSVPYHIVTMMNVLNELEEENDSALLTLLMSLLDEQGALIMIEPATRIESRRLLRFRDFAISRGATVYSPCTRQAGCPALMKEDDWCHTDIPWERPAFIKAIDDIVGTLRLSLKSTYLVLRKDGVTLGKALAEKNLYRIVSERFDEKGRVRAILCGENGRYEHIINKRDLTDTNRDFTNIQRYDVASLSGEEVREHDIRLLEDSTISIVLPILGAR